jgi:hypothetical protein
MMVALVAICSGCAAADRPQQVVFDGSVPKAYTSVDELAADATALVYGEVTGSKEEKISDLPVTRYDVSIERSLGGTLSGVVGVYQTGTPEWVLRMAVAPHLRVGEKYVLFLQPMGLAKGTAGADGFGIVSIGAWHDQGGSLELDRNPDADKGTYNGFPDGFTLAQASGELSADRLGKNR